MAQSSASKQSSASNEEADDIYIDLTAMAPIRGISFDRYATLTKAIRFRRMRHRESAAYLQSQGVDPKEWKAVDREWRQRLESDSKLSSRFDTLFAVVRAG